MPIAAIRICGAFLIFLCHAYAESGSSIGGALGQVFSIGVPIFFMLSGYLHGQKCAPQNKLRWYLKKLKRLLLPLYVFIAILSILYLSFGLYIDLSCWWQTFIPICGLTQIYIPGCGHLWFLTHLLICYLITPALQEHGRLKKSGIAFVTVLWAAACAVLAYTVPPIYCTLLNSLFSYALGFYALSYLLQRKHNYCLLLMFAALACCCRLLFRRFFDGTPIYNSVVVEACSSVLALSIVVLIFQIGKKLEESLNSRVQLFIVALSNRTYEFYLVHYIFLKGPLKIKMPDYFLSVLTAFVLSVAFAGFVHMISNPSHRK